MLRQVWQLFIILSGRFQRLALPRRFLLIERSLESKDYPHIEEVVACLNFNQNIG